MIEINLMPSGAARRAAPARAGRAGASLPKLGADPRVAGLGAAGIAVLLVCGWLFWTSGAKLGELSAQVTREEQEAKRLERTLSMLSTLQAQRDTIDRKINVIKSVDGRRYVWPHLMDEVSRAVPQFTWLTKVAAIEEEAPPPPVAAVPEAEKEKGAKADSAAADTAAFVVEEPVGPSFNIEGNAATTQSLTRFMKNLEASPMIREVALVTSEQTEDQGRTYHKFTIEARYETPDSSLVESVPVIPVQ